MKKLIVPLLGVSLLILIVGCGTGNNQSDPGFYSKANFKKNEYQRIIHSNNQLGFDLLPNAEPNGDGNKFISPTSLLMALSMVYNGADGVTKEEMGKVLHSEGMEAAQLNKANASLMAKLQSDSKQSQLNIANSIWLNNQFHFQDDFSQNNRDYFIAKIQEIDVMNPETPTIINDWVKKSTSGKIDKIVDKEMEPDIVAFLINAIYFKGNWMHEFDKKLTEKRVFHLDTGTSKEIPLMTINRKFAYLENETFQAVTLPYADGKMSMEVFLPKEKNSLEEFGKLLTTDNWEKWNSEFQPKEGTVLLPKFQLEYEIEWKEALKKLGMSASFDRREADFSKMIKEDNPVWIEKVKQKTFIDVNEEGSEAAGVTSVEMKTESAPIGIDRPFRMEVNRPFFIAITNIETGAILFMGAISNPQ